MIRCHLLPIALALISTMVHFKPALARNATVNAHVQDETHESTLRIFSQHASTNAVVAIISIFWIALLGRNAVPVLAIAIVSRIPIALLTSLTALPIVAVISIAAIPLFMVTGIIELLFLAIAGIVALPCIAMYGISQSPLFAIAGLVGVVCVGIFVAILFTSTSTPFRNAHEKLQQAAFASAPMKTKKKNALAAESNGNVFFPYIN